MGRKDKEKKINESPTGAQSSTSKRSSKGNNMAFDPNNGMSEIERKQLNLIGFQASGASDNVNKRLSSIPGVSDILGEAAGLRNRSGLITGRISPQEVTPTRVPKNQPKEPSLKSGEENQGHEEIKRKQSVEGSPKSDDNNIETNDLDQTQKTPKPTFKATPQEIPQPSSSAQIDTTAPPSGSKKDVPPGYASSIDKDKLNWALEMEKVYDTEKCYESVISTFKTLNLDTSPLVDLEKSVVTESKLSYWEGARDVVSLMASLYHQKSSEAVDTITSCSLNTNTLVNSFKSDLELLHASIGNPKVDLANILKEIRDIKELVISNGASASRPSSVVQDRAESKITSIVKESKKVDSSKVTSAALNSISIALPKSPTWGQLRSHLIKLKYKEDEAEKITKYLTKFQGGEKQYVYDGSIKLLQEAREKRDLPEEFRKRLAKELLKK